MSELLEIEDVIPILNITQKNSPNNKISFGLLIALMKKFILYSHYIIQRMF